jgi:hypothetical protein
MKAKIIFLGLLASFTIFSCKNNESATETPKEVQQKQSMTFDVTLDIVIPSDCDLILYYKDGTNEWFDEEKAVWAGVKGNNNQQTVVFNLPEGVIPNDIRLDIGRNEFKGLQNVAVKKLTLSYLSNKFDITEDQMAMYFKPNQYISFDPATKLYSFKKDEKGNYDPFFESKPELYPKFAIVAGN